ncbi:hypothetical protein ACJMK2_042516 [Sinanodonta woodiana]|uniref:Uncharacterized protein n=1 Tax=Sinanodonta woodiana TaxID=1069815 RepID=A0ABD3W7L2_SINWO
MVKITEDLIRKRAEHNNCEISTLEEVSLHQQDIERIEYIDKWCRDLKILYLQSNLIPKIENVGRLKKLEYLNLALNNVERVENLEGCESLKKLDLTVNFIGELTSIECLRDLCHLQEMYLTGNPCSEYDGYREYVIATLQQLRYFDGQEVEKSERIKALQNYGIVRPRILQQQEAYRKKREKQKAEAEMKATQKMEEKKEMKPGFDGRWYTDINSRSGQESQEGKSSFSEESDKEAKKIESEKDEIEKTAEFWKEKVAYTPESRIEIHQHMQEQKNKDKNKE